MIKPIMEVQRNYKAIYHFHRAFGEMSSFISNRGKRKMSHCAFYNRPLGIGTDFPKANVWSYIFRVWCIE